jgi:hypothetical protein
MWMPPLVVALNAFQMHLFLLVPAYALRDRPWSWVLYPAIAILSVRDKTMAEGTAAMMKEHEQAQAAVLIVGRAHVSGLARELVKRHNFSLMP